MARKRNLAYDKAEPERNGCRFERGRNRQKLDVSEAVVWETMIVYGCRQENTGIGRNVTG
ncbi:MAG TPA: hypothetical protein H9672_00555 [Firmicutes bacterium]|nr:hypothetical protein [Bacillota bacterium]